MSVRFYTTEQVAEMTGLTVYQVQAARRSGRLPHREVGPRPLIRFTDDDLTEFARRTKAADQPAALITTRRKRRRSA